MPELIHACRAKYPAVRIHLHEQTSRGQLDALESGPIDVGFTRPLPRTQAGRFVQELVYRDCVAAVLSDRHALAGLRTISLEKLANEDWVLLSRSTAPEVVDGFTLLCTNAGFSPRVISEPARMQAVLTMVAAGVGVSFAAGCDSRLTQPGVTFIPIQPARLHLILSLPVLTVNRRRRWQLFSKYFGNSFRRFGANTLTI